MFNKISHWLKITFFNGVFLVAAVVVVELLFGNYLQYNFWQLDRLNLIKGKTIKYVVSDKYNSPEGFVIYTRDKFGLQTDFYDDAHNTPQGAEKIGKYLYEKLKQYF